VLRAADSLHAFQQKELPCAHWRTSQTDCMSAAAAQHLPSTRCAETACSRHRLHARDPLQQLDIVCLCLSKQRVHNVLYDADACKRGARASVFSSQQQLLTLRCGILARICACLLRLADPTTEPSGSSLRSDAVGLMNTSRTSSRGRLQGRTVPSGRGGYILQSGAHTRSTHDSSHLTSATVDLVPERVVAMHHFTLVP